MGHTQIITITVVTALLVGWSSALVWPATECSKFSALVLIGFVATMWWQAWRHRRNTAARDAHVINAVLMSALFMFAADDVQTLATAVRDCLGRP